MAFPDALLKAQTYFPKLQVKYKDQSTFMQLLGKLMFFNPKFMTEFVTTIGNTIYIPNHEYTQTPNGITVFLHEVVHIYDNKRLSFLYPLSCALPQLLFFPSLLLFFLSWKIALPVALFFLLPLPSPFRAYFEKRAYEVQLYVLNHVWGASLDDLYRAADVYNGFFTGSAYYFMWPFGEGSSFRSTAATVSMGNDPVDEHPLMNMIDDLIVSAKI